MPKLTLAMKASISTASIIRLVLLAAFLVSTNQLAAQNVTPTGRGIVKGKIVGTLAGQISIKGEDSKTVKYKIQNKGETAISIEGRPIRVPAEISVTGTIPVKLTEKGMIFKFKGKTNLYGKSKTQVHSITVLRPETDEKLEVDFLERKDNKHDECECNVVGRVINLSKNTLQLEVEEAKWSRRGRINFTVAEDCVLNISDDHLNRVRPGDTVNSAEYFEFASGEKVIRKIGIKLTAERNELTTTFNDKLEQKYSNLSDDPSEPRELRSKHFVLYTDVSDRSGNILLEKLETMYGLVSGYYAARPRKPIECYVVRDLSKWKSGDLDPRGVAKIAEPAGVTIFASNGREVKAVVYSCDRHAVVQHEAVHAFCAMTFGSPGPVWYAEGMAEMGQYWKPGELAVNVDPVVIEFLTTDNPKKLADIVAAGQITGDSWQAYAWRWALCHLLANNPNYSRRFKKLGLNIMAKKPDSFDQAFGKIADKISFEYDQFVENFGNGYRVDLCVWDWNTKASNLSSDGRIKVEVKAQEGWQATKLLARPRVSYDYVAQGKWKTSTTTEEVSADGHADGSGKLIGVFYKDFQLGEPFELGERGSFQPDEEAQLYVRCRDSWTGLSDNDGKLTFYIRRTPKEDDK